MKKQLVMVGSALLAGALLTVPVGIMITPEGSSFDIGWLSGAIWLLIPLIVALRTHQPGNQLLSPTSWKESLPEIVLVLFVLGYLFTGVTTHNWFYFIKWSPYSTLNPFHSGPAGFFFLVSFFWTIFLVPRTVSVERLMLLLVLGTQIICFVLLLAETKGLPLYRDDHPSFMFRLWAFGSIFPRLTSYTPYWNGGVIEGVISKTGIAGPGILLWPLWKFAKIEHVYTPAIGFIYIVFIPWMTALSLRLMRISWTGALVGCLLSGSLSLTYFLWFLHFGTIGANFSSAFILPFGACLYRIVLLDDKRILTVILLTLSAYFLILWPPGAIMLFAVLSGFLFHLQRFSWRKMGFLLLAGAMTALFYLQPAVIILQGTELIKFVTKDVGSGIASNRSAIDVIMSGLFLLAEQAHRANPLLVLLGGGGILILKDRSLRLWLFPIIILLLLIAGWGDDIFPHLQLHRMIIPCLFMLVIPAVISIERLFRLPGAWAKPLWAVLLALLFLTGLNGARIYANKGPAPYVTLSPRVHNLAETIMREVPKGGRVLFAGKTVHAFGAGHIAFLPGLTGREMMACDYYGFPPELVEPNYPPRKYRLADEDIFRFMDIYNVVLIATYHSIWREFFLDHPEQFEPLRISHKKHDYSLFRLNRKQSVLFEGEGTVEADFNIIRVKPAPGQESIVLRYNWNDSLTVDDGPAVIRPRLIWKDIRFVEILPHGADEIIIHHRSWL